MSKFSVRKPFTVLVAVIVVLVFGVMSYVKMVPDLLPNDERFAGLWDYCLPTLHDLCPLIDRLNGEAHA